MMNLWMDTARIRWTVRHKQHIRQEACFLGNRFIPPHSALSRPVWPIKQTLRIRTHPTKKAPCKPVNAAVKNNRIIYGKSRPGLLRSSDAQGGFSNIKHHNSLHTDCRCWRCGRQNRIVYHSAGQALCGSMCRGGETNGGRPLPHCPLWADRPHPRHPVRRAGV